MGVELGQFVVSGLAGGLVRALDRGAEIDIPASHRIDAGEQAYLE